MTDLTNARHAFNEAQQRVPSGSTARVLEPSPPAIKDGEFFADDPASLGDADPATTVRPLADGNGSWLDLVSDDPELAAFARARWLGPWDRLGAVPAHYLASRDDFHRLAYAAVAAARHETNGKFGLRFTAGGFGTPFFGEDRQVRMVGNVLVDQRGDQVRQHQPTSINDAASFLGVEVSTVAAEGDSPQLDDVDRPLQLDGATGAFLGDWFGFVASVLEELRAEATADEQPSRVQLWPGHFDPAFELGDEASSRRATIGGSPGDGGSAEPYLYVGPWGGVTEDAYWNAESFPGAVLPYATIVAADDQRGVALEFLREGITLLAQR